MIFDPSYNIIYNKSEVLLNFFDYMSDSLKMKDLSMRGSKFKFFKKTDAIRVPSKTTSVWQHNIGLSETKLSILLKKKALKSIVGWKLLEKLWKI
jgi:hypothetical protein